MKVGPLLLASACVTACSQPQDAAPRLEAAAQPTGARPWLVDVTEECGIDFRHEAGARGEFLLPEIMGSGAALFDADGDGDLDAYLVNGRPDLDVSDRAVTNRLYRQEADGRFVDRTPESGLGDPGYGMGVAVGDVDNDGAPDVYVSNYGLDRLYRNRGDGTFEDVTQSAGVQVDGWSASAVFFDYDRDGHLDIYVTRYVRYEPSKTCQDAAGRLDYCTPQTFSKATDVLLHNEGDGTFEDVSAAAGILAVAGPGLGVVAEDFDDDGWPDVFVANDGAANYLWINGGDGTFREEAVVRGVAYNVGGRAEAGMGVACADFDDNGRYDLFLTHLDTETNTLYLNGGAARGFDDATAVSGVAPPGAAATGFGVAAFDLELDGDLDLAVVNGKVTKGQPHPRSSVGPPWELFAQPKHMLVNGGGGRFSIAGAEVAPFAQRVEVSRGLAVGDVDNDGDIDLLVNSAGSGARLFRNDAPRAGAWLSVRAVDPRQRRDAIGARVTLVAGTQRRSRSISSGFSYLSSSPAVAHFGVAAGVVPQELEVRWPDGSLEWFGVDGLDRSMTVVRGAGRRGA